MSAWPDFSLTVLLSIPVHSGHTELGSEQPQGQRLLASELEVCIQEALPATHLPSYKLFSGSRIRTMDNSPIAGQSTESQEGQSFDLILIAGSYPVGC